MVVLFPLAFLYTLTLDTPVPPNRPERPNRKLLRRRENPDDFRFITFSNFRRLPLLRDPSIAEDLADRLTAARAKHGLLLFAWVIMPEHVHLLLRPAGSPWSAIAESIKTQSSRHAVRVMRARGDPNLSVVLGAGRNGRARFWQPGGGFDRNVRSMGEFTKAIRYIHRNPVERGLVAGAREWRWSSVRWWMGEREGERECDPPPGDPRIWQKWKGFM
jgi:putative transposase